MRPYLLMLGGAFSFAVMGAFAHAAGAYCDWQLIALSRSVLALSIAGLLAMRDKSRLVVSGPPSLWVRSIAGSLSVMCNFYALSRLPVADALTLTNMFPVWIAVLSWPVLGRFPEWEVWLGVVCGVIGVAVMQQPSSGDGNPGTIAAVTGSVTSAVALIGLHQLKLIAPNVIVVHFSFVSLLFISAALWLFPVAEGTVGWRIFEWPVSGLLVGVGVSAVVGQLLLTRAFAAGAPARVSVVGLSQVAFALIFDVVFFHRTIELHSVAGMLLVIGPTVWVMLRRDGGRTEQGAGESCEPDGGIPNHAG